VVFVGYNKGNVQGSTPFLRVFTIHPSSFLVPRPSLLFDDGFPPPLRLLNDSYTDRVKDTPRTSGSGRVGQRELAKTQHPMAETTYTNNIRVL